MIQFGHATKHKQAGQVMVEMALSAVGLVAVAFLIARVGTWLHSSLVTRNQVFQSSRVAAGQIGAGYIQPDPGGSERIHLIGPGAASAGGASLIGDGASGAPPSCPAGDNLISQSAVLRGEADALRDGTELMREDAFEDSNRADDLIGDVDEPDSANWFEQKSQDLHLLNIAIFNTTVLINQKKAAITVKQGQISVKQSQVNSQQTVVNSRHSQYIAAKNAYNSLICALGDMVCAALKASLLTTKNNAFNAWQAAIVVLNNLQIQLAQLQNQLAALQNQLTALENELAGYVAAKASLCNQVFPVTCTPPALHTKALQLVNEANALAADVQTLTLQIADNAQELQEKIVEADDLEKRGWALCASGDE